MRRLWIGTLAAVIVIAVVIAIVAYLAPPPFRAGDSRLSESTTTSAGPRRETRPTLDPALFVGKPATAHRAAREIPDVLDALYCYCGCDKHAGHKSLLSCYTDGHAVT